MAYRRLGRTDLMVSEIGIGTASLPDGEQGVATLAAAFAAGANLVEIEIADARAIAIVRDAVAGQRHRTVLAGTGNGDVEAVRAAIDALDGGHFDCYLVKDTSDVAAAEAIARDGLARAVGFASESLEEILQAIDGGGVDLVQLPYNLLHHEIEPVLRAALVADVGVLVCSPLAGGVLARSSNAERDAALRFLLDGPARTPAQAAIAWALSERRIGAVIAGARSPQQAAENVEAGAAAPLAPADVERAAIAAAALR